MIDPKLLFGKIKLAPGMHIADFGSGKTGTFVFPAAAVVGERGTVYAVDIMKESLHGLMKRAALDNMPHIHTVWADIERPGAVAIPPQSLDAVFMVNFLSAVKKREAALGEADRLTKPGGALLIVDWKNNLLSFAPPSPDLVPQETVRLWAGTQGYATEEYFDASAYHYGMVLRKAGAV